MLLRALFGLIFLAAIAETTIHGAGALAQAVLRREAGVAVHQQVLIATTTAQQAIAGAIAAGANPSGTFLPAAPVPESTCVLASVAGCAMAGNASIAFAAPASSAASPCPQASCTVYFQQNDAVSEGRIDATIAASATAPDGTVLATRTVQVVFRTLRDAPYATLAGSLDASMDALNGSGGGDDGGAAPVGAAPGTLIDVIYENALTGSTMPANVWHSQVQRPGTNAEAWSP